MKRITSGAAIGAAISLLLSGCGGDDSGGTPPPPPGQKSFVASIGPIAAWADTTGSGLSGPEIGTYAGKRQMQRGHLDPLTSVDLGQAAGVEVYKGSDGHIWAVDLTTTVSSAPAAVQRSSEAAATIDDLCSSTGMISGGSTYDYAGIFFAPDFAHPSDSTYAYRLPGADGACDTADDVVHVVKTGMDASAAPGTGVAMPATTIYDAAGVITGFVAKSGANLVMTDANLANPVTVGLFPATLGVAAALPIGATSGFPSGRLFVVDGNIVHVDYAAGTTSASLFQIPNWTPANDHLVAAASPTTLYFAVNVPASGSSPATSTIYAMPADGSAGPTVIASQTGIVRQMEFAVDGSALVVGTVDVFYSISAWPAAGGPPVLLVDAPTFNEGRFSVTADAVYYTTWLSSEQGATVMRQFTTSGIKGMDGTTIAAPLENSMFMGGGEADVFAAGDSTTQRTPFVTMFQAQNLVPVTVTVGATTYTEDGLSGATLLAIDTTTHTLAATLGVFPVSNATSLATATYRGIDHTLFLQAITPYSTQDPASMDVYLLNSRIDNSLVRATDNL
jgi:hypothetical protein